MSRTHHYQYAHRLLPKLAHEMGERLVDMAQQGSLDRPLLGSWNDFGQQLDEPDRVAPDGLAGTYHEVGGHRIALVTFPAPQEPPEAYFAAITTGGRYLVLEYGIDIVRDEPYTVMCEWTAEGSHLNGGPGPRPTADAFLTEVAQRL